MLCVLQVRFRFFTDSSCLFTDFTTDSLGIGYALRLKRRELLELCADWQDKLQSVPSFNHQKDEPWGPTDEELAELKIPDKDDVRFANAKSPVHLHTSGIDTDDYKEDIEEDLDVNSISGLSEDGEFLELAEAIESENARVSQRDELDYVVENNNLTYSQCVTPSPAKKARIGDTLYSLSQLD